MGVFFKLCFLFFAFEECCLEWRESDLRDGERELPDIWETKRRGACKPLPTTWELDVFLWESWTRGALAAEFVYLIGR